MTKIIILHIYTREMQINTYLYTFIEQVIQVLNLE